MALIEAKQGDKYKAIIGDAVEFLKKLQWDEDEGKTEKDPFFGGAGYDSKSRPDLSNTQMFLDALKSAGIGPDDPAMKKALKFVNRCQNIKGETNDQPWAKLINDGSFIYTPALGGATKVVDKALDNGALPGYGSMTYAGIKSMIYCGVPKDDDRIKKAYEWIKQNYSVDGNPGMPEPRPSGACTITTTRWPSPSTRSASITSSMPRASSTTGARTSLKPSPSVSAPTAASSTAPPTGWKPTRILSPGMR